MKVIEFVLKVLLLCLEGEFLKEIMEFWSCVFLDDLRLVIFVCLLVVFEEDLNNERKMVKRIFNFLE